MVRAAAQFLAYVEVTASSFMSVIGNDSHSVACATKHHINRNCVDPITVSLTLTS